MSTRETVKTGATSVFGGRTEHIDALQFPFRNISIQLFGHLEPSYRFRP
jgi:hypothetical protein